MDGNPAAAWLWAMKILPLLGLMLGVGGVLDVRRFIREVPVIRDKTDLARFKGLAARNMYAALMVAVLLGVPAALFLYALFSGQLTLSDGLYMAVVYTAVGIGGMWAKKYEQQVQDLPVSDPALVEERNRVVHTWLKKPFPDW